MPAARTTTTLIRNAVEAMQAAGLVVGGVRVKAGGVVEVFAATDQVGLTSPATGDESCDEIFGVGSS